MLCRDFFAVHRLCVYTVCQLPQPAHMKLSALLRQRSALAQQSAELAEKTAAISAQLERLDAELFARMKNLANAIEGDAADAALSATDVGRHDIDTPAMQAIASVFPGNYKLRFRRTRPVGLEPHIVSALSAAGRPMTRNELYDLMVSRGVEVPGKDPRANLSAHLSYSPKVTRTEAGLWALAKTQEAHSG